MTRTTLILPAALAVACLTLWPADLAAQGTARPRGGGSGQPAAGSPPPSGGGATTGRAMPRPPGSYPPTLDGGRYYRPYYRYYGYPYYRGYYAPYWGWGWGVGFGYGWGAWGYPYGYWPGHYWGPYPYYPGYYYSPYCDLRLEIRPREAEVYLDGYLVGVVDNFDGTFQRLHVPYGEHEVTVYAEGYQPIREKMLFRPGEDYKIKQVMQPLPQGAPNEPRPVPAAPPPDERRRLPVRGEEPEGWVQPQGPPPGAAPPQARAVMGEFGTLSIRVQPAAAEIIVDGEKWETPSNEDRLTLDLNEGTHRVEIRLEGYKPYRAEVRIRRGETQTLNVSLPKS